jgi:hypothetical protein
VLLWRKEAMTFLLQGVEKSHAIRLGAEIGR